ncbi:FAD-binding oxidoreductase [Candidatus Blochmannia ocreatus (nom. nud.)]|uniref:Flavodoxin/ferredoxin--NADP reductase n=1 Tax=Candidatus Blochmannia ocreatus (nom. nud.) TaxID=251538 RepID=A0ABY4SW98_9ENTR|nr:FAD-binding oxidoreductase [Candidatus Blochmannia ocreatus]URJ25066.1 FAD-binding oxidoreductase [Candidatus Blochmannia ocreatus]
MSEWVTGQVVNITYWTDQLFSLIVKAPVNKFIAGQFTRIGIKINNRIIQRAYSYINAPNDTYLEFYIATISSGKFTPMLHNLRPHDFIMLTKESYGHFILDEIPNCTNLWMLASGTGIGPYLSILTDNCRNNKLDRFSNIILIHAVRFARNLNYLTRMHKLQCFYRGKLHVYTIISREDSVHSLFGRIPFLIKNDILEAKVGFKLDNRSSHVMLCGNPYMIRDTKKILQIKYKMQDHYKNKPGHITQERYW